MKFHFNITIFIFSGETKPTVYPPYSMSRYSFAVLFLMSNYSERNKKKKKNPQVLEIVFKVNNT